MTVWPSRRATAARFHAAFVVLAALATLGFPGCPDDATRPPGNGGGDPYALTMSNCWPNDDGRYWTYTMTQRALENPGIVYTPLDQEVPTVTLADVRHLLAMPVTISPGGVSDYAFQMLFSGMGSTASGAVAQNLVETTDPVAAAGLAASRSSFGEAFLERLAEARPDLRARLAARGVKLRQGPGAAVVPIRPFFIHGYIWRKTSAWIGTFGDIDTLLAWKFLDSDVRPGHTFQHLLLPSLASDLWLKASIERQVAINVPDRGRVDNALEVLYLIDYGVSLETDESGNVLGKLRWFDYGKVVYVPGTGPVRDLERRLAIAREPEHTLGIAELELNLQTTGVVAPGLRAAAGR